jgi:hypothetical protein
MLILGESHLRAVLIEYQMHAHQSLSVAAVPDENGTRSHAGRLDAHRLRPADQVALRAVVARI